MNVPRSVAMHWFPRGNDGAGVADPRADTDAPLRNDELHGICTKEMCHEAPNMGADMGSKGDAIIWGVILWGVLALVAGLWLGRLWPPKDAERINNDEG